MKKIRKFYPGTFQHVYNISNDSGIVFYSIIDFVVWFTVFCTYARKYDVLVLAVCAMLNHTHELAKFKSLKNMGDFERDVNSVFSLKYNRRYGQSGRLFRRDYGNAPKYSESKLFDCFIYIINNPKVKNAVESVQDYRMNLLAYANCPNPYSEPICKNRASSELLLLMSLVDGYIKAGTYIGYEFFDGVYNRLSKTEQAQAIDYIISSYNVIDYETAIEYFGSFKKMITAIESVSGSEHDIREEYCEENYRHHYKMIRIASKVGYNLRNSRFPWVRQKNTKEKIIQHLPEIQRLSKELISRTGSTIYEVGKFLHVPQEIICEGFSEGIDNQ